LCFEIRTLDLTRCLLWQSQQIFLPPKQLTPKYCHLQKELALYFGDIGIHSKFNLNFLFQISTDHFFSIAKARQLLDYNPVPCGPEDWKVIKDSLRFLKKPQKSGRKIHLEGLLSKVVEFLRSLFSYTIFFFCTIYFYIIFFGSYLTLGL
jgi:hypothetical protein